MKETRLFFPGSPDNARLAWERLCVEGIDVEGWRGPTDDETRAIVCRGDESKVAEGIRVLEKNSFKEDHDFKVYRRPLRRS